MSSPATSAREVVAHARAHSARLGSGRLICVDGPSGTGKSTLAGQIAQITGSPVVRMDDLYPGWQGLFEVDPHVLGLLEPLAEGRSGSYRRYDWHAKEYAETHHVEPGPLLVLEGVGAGNRAWRHLVTTLVWLDAAAELRLERSVARDGEDQRELLVQWRHDEDRLFAEQGTRSFADLVFSTGLD